MKIIYPLQHAEPVPGLRQESRRRCAALRPARRATLISKATAGEIKANFIALGLHQILDMWIGGSEKTCTRSLSSPARTRPASCKRWLL